MQYRTSPYQAWLSEDDPTVVLIDTKDLGSDTGGGSEGWDSNPWAPTFPNFEGRPAYNSIIDHIFVGSEGYAPQMYEVCVGEEFRNVSDHRLVRCRLMATLGPE